MFIAVITTEEPPSQLQLMTLGFAAYLNGRKDKKDFPPSTLFNSLKATVENDADRSTHDVFYDDENLHMKLVAPSGCETVIANNYTFSD